MSGEEYPGSNYSCSKEQPSSNVSTGPIQNSKFQDPKLDPAWLHQVLKKEINKEITYDLENAAKLRAVSQGTVNYEQFRQMVLGAHLRPIEQKDKVEGCQNGKRPPVVWNNVAEKRGNSK